MGTAETPAAPTTAAHHFANVLFNIMRGGIFMDGYRVQRDDLVEFFEKPMAEEIFMVAGWHQWAERKRSSPLLPSD